MVVLSTGFLEMNTEATLEMNYLNSAFSVSFIYFAARKASSAENGS